MTEAGRGIGALVGACVIWGLAPILYKLMDHIPAMEVLAHRIVWSLVLFGTVVAVQGRLKELFAFLRNRRDLAMTGLATATISVNWFLFIWAILSGRALEASLGYYIFPLVSVMLGVVFHAEGLNRAKLCALGLAALAVAVLTFGLGVAPWVSLTLAASFGLYGLIKKSIAAGPVLSVTAEVLLFTPLALFWLWGVHNHGWTGVSGRNLATFGNDLSDSLLLMLSGPLTAIPLVLFSYGARRVTMATTGLVQYLNPSLQFAVATLIFAEPLTRWHAIAFPLIWAALAVYSVWAIRQERSARRAAIRSSIDPTAL